MTRIISTSGVDAYGSIIDQRMIDDVRLRGYKFLFHESWLAGPNIRPLDGYDSLYNDNNKNWEALYYEENVVAYVRYTFGGSVWVRASASSEDLVRGFIDRVKKHAPDIDPPEGYINLKFWTLGQRGPHSVTRRIDAPEWNEISDNYTDTTRGKLHHLVDGFEPAHGGQLLLWHGAPGTGKTYALRSLIREWNSWCDAEYVVDPEVFFGSSPTYMMQVLLDSGGASLPWEDEDGDEPEQKWRLLIFEDTGELLSRDAGVRSGQGLSRLLNTVDGLIGQGLRVLILITTNEELGSLHEAVSRPGRTAAKAHFTDLSPAEAATWAARNKIALPGERQYRLAELFAIRDGFAERDVEHHHVGFAP